MFLAFLLQMYIVSSICIVLLLCIYNTYNMATGIQFYEL